MRCSVPIVTVFFVPLCLAHIPIKRVEHSDLNAFNEALLSSSESKLSGLSPLEYLQRLKRLGKIALYIRLYRRLHQSPYSAASGFTAAIPKPPVQFDEDLYRTCHDDFVNCTDFIFSNVQERATFMFPVKGEYLKDFAVTQENFRRMVSNNMFEFDMTASYIMCYFTKNRVTALRYLPFCRYNANASDPYNIASHWSPSRFKAAEDRDDFNFWPRHPYYETIDDLVNGFKEFQCAEQSFCPNPCCVDGQDDMTTQCRHPACTDPLANTTNYLCEVPLDSNRDLPGLVHNDWNITCDCGEKQEYRLDIRRCVHLNECLDGPCNDYEECVKTVGSFECVCKLGYLRNRDGNCSEIILHKTEWHGEAVKSASSALHALSRVYLSLAFVHTVHAVDFSLL